MANSIIQLPVDSTGKKLDTEELVVGANTVHRERHQIAGDSDTDIAPVTAADGLLVNLGANNDVVDTAAEASLAIIDDWDETDRAKVNPIVGQAGVQGGSGVITALTQRVVLATDQPTVPVSLAAGGTTQYAEDTAHSSGDQVTLAGVVQQAADAALSTDGDRSLLQVDASGFLKVNIKAGAGSGGTAMADDAAFTPAVTQGTPAFAFADETAPDSVDEGDAGALRMTLDRKLLTRVVGATDANRLDVDASGHAQVDIAAASVTVPVSAASLPLPTGASTLGEQQTQTAHLAAIETAVEILDNAIAGSEMQVDIVAALPAGTNNIGDVDVLSSALPTGASTLAEQQTQTTHLATIAGDTTAIETAIQILDDWDETDRAKVNPIAGQAGVQGASGTVTALTQRVVLATDVALPAGTNNIGDIDVLTMPVTEVVGDVAADAAVPANPLSIGGRASTAVPTAVSADGDSVYNWLNRLGMQVVSAIPGLGLNADPHTLLSETAQYTTTQTSTVLVAGGASERIVVTSIQIQVGGTTAGTVQVYFGTGAYVRGTDEAIFDGEFAPSATLKPGFFAAPPSGFRAGALGDDILVTTSAAINPITVTVWYYILGV